MAKMSEDKLKAVVANEILRCIGYLGGTIAIERQNALDRYYGRLYGDEVAGQSKVVSQDISEVIEGIMPSIIES